MTLRAMFTSGAIVASLASLAACGGDASLDRAGSGKVAIVMSASGTLAAATEGMSATEKHETCDLGRELRAANVTFSSFLARTLEGKLIDVTIDLPFTVDMLSLGNGKEATLPVGFLPPGTYDQIVVVMTEVEVTLQNGTKVAITPPGGGWTVVVPVAEPFIVAEGETTTIKLRFRPDLSFACGLGDLEFHPRFDCDR